MFSRIVERFSRNLPLVNFALSSAGLMFQTCVLHPWHNQLSKQMDQLNKQLQANKVYSPNVISLPSAIGHPLYKNGAYGGQWRNAEHSEHRCNGQSKDDLQSCRLIFSP